MERKDNVILIVEKEQRIFALYFMNCATELPFDLLIVVDFAGIFFICQCSPFCYLNIIQTINIYCAGILVAPNK